MIIYLIGPYTSDSLELHRKNLGRLFSYYSLLHLYRKHDSVICPPLMTAGFDYGYVDLINQDWLEKCLALLDRSDRAYSVPGSESSYGAQVERDHCRKYGIRHENLKRINPSDLGVLHIHMGLIKHYNQFAKWALLYLDEELSEYHDLK